MQLLNILKSDPQWRDTISSKRIKIKESGDLAIFNYEAGCDWSDPVVCEARGVIIDTKNMRVVCRAFDKFFNYEEQWAAKINWESAMVQEKIDGSLIKLWYYNDEWHWSTNSCIDARNATVDDTGTTFMDIIKYTVEYTIISSTQLDKNCTYIFELVSPENKVVIDYESPQLYHLATRETETGYYFDQYIGVQKPRLYPIKTLSDCVNFAKDINKNGVKHEGFVVVDRHNNRIKVKTPEYIQLARVSDKRRVLTVDDFISGNYDRDQLNDVQQIQLEYYELAMNELCYRAGVYADFVRGLYEEYDGDRSAVGKKIQDDSLSFIGFMGIRNNKTGKELVDALKPSVLKKLIPKYDMKRLNVF